MGVFTSNLSQENEDLKIQNAKLIEYIEDLKHKQNIINFASIEQESSNNFERKMEESVKKLVDNMLENNSINSSLIPDYIERKIYENVFTIFIGLLKEVLENTNINLLNQNISLKINPQ
jgi:hypothetical protein